MTNKFDWRREKKGEGSSGGKLGRYLVVDGELTKVEAATQRASLFREPGTIELSSKSN